jgi:hypothetical protein
VLRAQFAILTVRDRKRAAAYDPAWRSFDAERDDPAKDPARRISGDPMSGPGVRIAPNPWRTTLWITEMDGAAHWH